MCDSWITQEINRAGGLVTFEHFMALCLYHPQYGYYTSAKATIGPGGDFFTSPHLHPAFGRLIGRQIVEMWEVMGKPAPFVVVEYGPGEGWLSADLLDCLRTTPLYESLRYVLIELNPYMMAKQRERLSAHTCSHWVSSIESIECFNGVVLSNELVDAFPVHLIKVIDGRVMEAYIDAGLNETYRPPGDEVEAYMQTFNINLADGYKTEVNTAARKWLTDISSHLKAGFVLTIDYGYTQSEYYAPERSSGTLLCYHRHKISDNPCEFPGQQDITSFVNFASLKRWGDEAGLKSVGYTSQGAFLISLGVDRAITGLSSQADYAFDILKIKRLILPDGMGETHKVLIQYKGEGTPALSGLTLRNKIKHLDPYD